MLREHMNVNVNKTSAVPLYQMLTKMTLLFLDSDILILLHDM